MPTPPPLLSPVASPGRKLLRIALIGLGASLTVSAVVNGLAAWQLIEPDDEKSLGLTRSEVLGWYAFVFAAGLLLLALGLSLRSSRRPTAAQ